MSHTFKQGFRNLRAAQAPGAEGGYLRKERIIYLATAIYLIYQANIYLLPN